MVGRNSEAEERSVKLTKGQRRSRNRRERRAENERNLSKILEEDKERRRKHSLKLQARKERRLERKQQQAKITNNEIQKEIPVKEPPPTRATYPNNIPLGRRETHGLKEREISEYRVEAKRREEMCFPIIYTTSRMPCGEEGGLEVCGVYVFQRERKLYTDETIEKGEQFLHGRIDGGDWKKTHKERVEEKRKRVKERYGL